MFDWSPELFEHQTAASPLISQFDTLTKIRQHAQISTMFLCMLTNFSKLGKSTKLDKNDVLTNFLLGGLRTQTSAASCVSGPTNTFLIILLRGCLI